MTQTNKASTMAWDIFHHKLELTETKLDGRSRIILTNAVFCSNKAERSSSPAIPETLPQPTRPSSVISDVWDKISAQTNPYQLYAIESIMLGKSKENITLLQGPPGTGKTLTIVNLVGCLLNGSVPIPGARNPRTVGTRIQVSSLCAV